jgi:hypothetical protein
VVHVANELDEPHFSGSGRCSISLVISTAVMREKPSHTIVPATVNFRRTAAPCAALCL